MCNGLRLLNNLVAIALSLVTHHNHFMDCRKLNFGGRPAIYITLSPSLSTLQRLIPLDNPAMP